MTVSLLGSRLSFAVVAVVLVCVIGCGTSGPSWVRFRITMPELAQAPVLINWDSLSVHPSIDSPAGCELTDLTLVVSSQAPYQRLLQVLPVGAGIRKGGRPRLELTLSCPKGIVRLGAK